MTSAIPFIDLQTQRQRLADRVDDAVLGVLDHGQFIMGPEVEELEDRLADYCGVDHAVTCSSGTDALLLPLLAWGVGAGDAVFVPAFTFAATAEAVVLAGATPVFVDVDEEIYAMEPESLRSAVEQADDEGLRPRVVIPVDLFGHPAPYPALQEIADDHGLRVVADAAQSFGAELGGTRVGAFGDCTATSFFPAKPLGCYGDGGAVLTDDDELAALLRSCRIHGQGETKYDNVRIGINGRLDTIQAAVLLLKLEIFDDERGARQQVAARYAAGLRDVVGVPATRADARSAWAQYTVRSATRDVLAKELAAAGIPTAVYYPSPLSDQLAYAAYPTAPGGCPVAHRLADEVLSLPMHPYLRSEDQQRIVDAVRAAV